METAPYTDMARHALTGAKFLLPLLGKEMVQSDFIAAKQPERSFFTYLSVTRR